MTEELTHAAIERCILCGSKKVSFFCRDDDSRRERLREFFRCASCSVIFTHPEYRLSAEAEFERYEQHENDPADPDYRQFLSQVFKPLQKKLLPGSTGLDFGSGPGPTLNVMLEEAGHKVRLYDIFYADHPEVFDREYDFITATETAEHLYNPRYEFNRLWRCLKPGGWLAVMTRLVPSDPDPEWFKEWHYKTDDTHVVFYATKTFHWLGDLWGTEPEFYPGDVMLFHKPE